MSLCEPKLYQLKTGKTAMLDDLMHKLYFRLLDADVKYPLSVPKDVDPIVSFSFTADAAQGDACYFLLAKLIGCAVICSTAERVAVGRETNIAIFKQYEKHLSKPTPSWHHKQQTLEWWLAYDDDFDVEIEDRRSTILAPARASRIAAEAVAWKVVGMYPELRDYRTKTGPSLKPRHGGLSLGGILPVHKI